MATASKFGEVLINGNIATGETRVSLSLNEVTYVDMQLQSAQFGCPIQGYSIEITHVSTKLAAFNSSGYITPEWNPVYNTFTVVSTEPTLSISFQPVSKGANCELFLASGIQSCDSIILNALSINSTETLASVSLFVIYDVPILSHTYYFTLQQQVCSFSSLTLRDLENEINCTSTANSTEYSTFCISSVPVNTTSIEYVGNQYCRVYDVRYLNWNNTWSPCFAPLCPLEYGLNHYRATVGSSFNTSSPRQFTTFNVANADVAFSIGNGAYDADNNIISSPCSQFTASASAQSGFDVKLLGGVNGTFSSSIPFIAYNVIYKTEKSLSVMLKIIVSHCLLIRL